MDYPKKVPNIGLVNGKFADEDTLAGTPGSLIPAGWGNGVTDELLAVITAAGMVPDEDALNQLNQAINKKISNAAMAIASQVEAESGADVNKVMTPIRVVQAINKFLVQATETVTGMLRIATQPETNLGESDSRAVTPLKLRNYLSNYIGQATETVFGWAKIATATQVADGSDDKTIVTPYKLSKGGSILGIAQNGHIKLPSWLGRFSIQWATYTVTTTDTAFSFPATFESMVGCWAGFFPTSSTALGTVEVVYVKSFSNATVTLQCSAGTRTVKVFAIGLIP